uniref:Protein LURP-one-related 15 n=1 Tax=Kalanchoe fedtschenkoi TaxID=63787 RepID=A0A7N0UFS8_KALFE
MMAAGASYPPMPNMVAVVNPHFCAPYPVDLTIARKLFNITEGNFAVTDVNGSIMFKIKGKFFSIRDRRLLLDAADRPVLTLQQKVLTAHRRWQVFRGDSTSSSDLLFSVKKSSLLQFKTELDVFLASNTSESVCDFKVKGSWFERSCSIHAANSNAIIAQMHRKHTVQSIVLGKDTFAVTVYPNVDYAFIVALVVVLEEINEDRDGDD